MHPLDDTIAAIASAPGGAARGIVRLSGPDSVAAVDRFLDATLENRPTVVAGNFRLAGMSPLPCDVYCWPSGRSYTGQSVVEIHTLGSTPLLDALLNTVCEAGVRLASPGEFTLRAFLAGRIDLTQAEAVLGVIDAADPQQLDVALAQLAGGLARPLHELRDRLLDLLAHLEAGFDFADEDLSFVTSDELRHQLEAAQTIIDRLARQMASRSETTEQIRVVLLGQPNTGKSSLFNALAQKAGALVSKHPGTTRDYLTATLDLDGVKCQLIDTAGIRSELPDEDAELEQAAQSKTLDQSRRADVEVLCLDATRSPSDWEQAQLAHASREQRVIVTTKVDMAPLKDLAEVGLATSSVTGEGIDALREALRDAVLTAGTAGSHVVAGTAIRCRESLRLAAECLDRAGRIVESEAGEELVAAEIRVGLEEIGKVAGAVYTDDLLDRIFSRFCIGK